MHLSLPSIYLSACRTKINHSADLSIDAAYQETITVPAAQPVIRPRERHVSHLPNLHPPPPPGKSTTRNNSSSPPITSNNEASDDDINTSTSSSPTLTDEMSSKGDKAASKQRPRSLAKKAAAPNSTTTATNGARKSLQRVVASSNNNKKQRTRSTSKKRKSTTSCNNANTNPPKYPINTPLSKIFLDEDTLSPRPFSGKVAGYNSRTGYYSIVYEDGDGEEMTERELSAFVVGGGVKRRGGKSNKKEEDVAMVESSDDDDDEEEEHATKGNRSKKPRVAVAAVPKKKNDVDDMEEEENSENEEEDDPPPVARGRRPRRSAAKKINYAYNDDDNDMFDDDEEEEMPKKKKAGATKSGKKGGNKKTTKKKADDDSDAFVLGSESESEEEMDEADFESSDDDDYDNGVGKKKNAKKKPAAKKKKAASKTKESKQPAAAAAATTGKSMAEAFKPQTTPLNWTLSLDEIKKRNEFLDPCGMEATDDIIDGIIGEQLDKVLPLLCKALKYNGKHSSTLGSKNDPLLLGTACSGTDAPALAMTLVQEQLEKRGLGDIFKHDHVFSCEKEPFKQAYLARNFDSILYPDITKLIDNPPKDCYGRPVPLPSSNLFVAGTSCKNFSMLRATRRLDIEDMGCSGETFLAACELLFKEKPKYAIFENVDKAPWEKMGEYITGRINLATVGKKDKIKKINGASKGKSGHLEFIRKDGGSIVVENVPAEYGVRCGATVSGYTTEGSGATMHEMKWPNKSKKSCTLDELIKHNGIDRKTATLLLESDVVYCTKYLKVDTKQFGLPQTRQRVYMFVWQPDDGNVDDDLGDYWAEIVRHLESPVRHALESFILPVDHDNIRVFREALNGPAGRNTIRSINQAPDFWDEKCSGRDLRHNKIARDRIGIEDRARSQTNWDAFGKMALPHHYWLEYMKCNSQRRLDMLEILHASAARDAECHDSNHASFAWNLSQNCSKEKHRQAKAGIASCITPGGDLFIPHAGRTLLGCERLLLQGIPLFRLQLGNETEVQLGDLAGNAMSLPVVNATMLAAMMCKQLRREHAKSSSKTIEGTLKAINKAKQKVSLQSECTTKFEGETTDTSALFKELSAMSNWAIDSSIWCTCETSGKTSSTEQFLRCRECSMSVCRDCVHVKQGYSVESHSITEHVLKNETHSQEDFEVKLRSILPANLILGEDGLNEIAAINKDKHRVADLSEYMFGLHRIKRDRLKWIILYYARDGKIGEAVGEFKLTIGELESKSADATAVAGVQGELTSFFPARRPPVCYGPISPCATMRLCRGQSKISWIAKAPDTVTNLTIAGCGTTPSFRVQVGLTDEAADAMIINSQGAQKAHFKTAKERGEVRRWLYAENWKEWPKQLIIDDDRMDDSDANLGGTYNRVGCLHSFNQNACWIRKETDSSQELYFLIKPDVSRNGPDTAIISSSSCHDDVSSILATLPWEWQPCDAMNDEMQHVKVSLHGALELNEMKCLAPKTNFSVEAPMEDDSSVLIKMNGLSDTDIDDLCSRDDDSGSKEIVALNVHRGAKVQQTVRRINHLCSAPFLKHSAEKGLKYDLKLDSSWMTIEQPSDVFFGRCQVTIPERPVECWIYDDERNEWQRTSEIMASRKYFSLLRSAPQCFDFIADRKEGSLTVRCNPQVAAHHAAFGLIDGRGLDMERDVSVTFRLLSTNQKDPTLRRFLLHNCRELEETSVKLKGFFDLYERQKKALTKMLNIEAGNVQFEEIEMSEQNMPGSTGWSLVAKASRTSQLRGGVIADAIGSGKTVISIAIILKGIVAARMRRKHPRKSSATLVVVPPALISQWRDEINKFTDELPSVLCIYDDSSLKNVTVKEMLHADVVICPVDLLEAKNYMARITKYSSGSTNDFVPKVPSNTGQVEKSGASGVWIPASSQDPYGGANNANNQKRRNEAAYFTYLYHDYIRTLRKKSFKGHEKGVPLEYFEWERVFVDEIHECLCTTKDELNEAKKRSSEDKSGFHKEKNRRAGREFLGITTKDIARRPLVFRTAIFGLTATPLLDSTNRVIELANLMGNAYVIGLSSHWRRLERESGRDIFLSNFLEPKQSREMRKNIYAKCQDYLDQACCKNKNEEDMEGIELVEDVAAIRMSEEEGQLYKSSQSGISPESKGFGIKVEDFDPSAGHDVSRFLRQNARLASRGKKLVQLCKQILEGNEQTKIVVFADGRISAGHAAAEFLRQEESLGCTFFDETDSVEEQNKKLSWYQYADVTAEDKKRPRVLVLNFAHAAGLNLQAECNNMILFSPLYIGDGGVTSDPVADVSTELQAIGRVFRPGQPKSKVNVYRIHVQGPNGEECVDGQLIRRNTDQGTIQMAVNADD